MSSSASFDLLRADTDHVAIIGLATRFPGDFSDTEKLWKSMLLARSAATPIPKDRFNAEAFYHPDPEHGGTFATKGGSFLREDPAYFDGAFFNFVKSELLSIDPQQRLLLESVYHALENAGLPLEKVAGSDTCVYVSGFNHDHRDTGNIDPETASRYTIAGSSNTFLSNRVSWFYDFQGQSVTIDTACSSSMVGIHQAVQSLRSGESKMAVVCGVNIMEHPTETINMSQYGVLSPEGISYSFDHRANGYGRGEGVGSLVLKPVAAALRDGDTIRAVIRGSGAQHNGRTPGISLPSGKAQEKLIKDVYRNAGLSVSDTAFVEAHGTGTAVGDPIEANAIASAFQSRRRKTPLYIGAVKSSIGHLEGASGVAGIIKSVMILENAIIPPNVNFEKVNEKINHQKLKISFPLENAPWPSSGLRRISVSSFGVGGTNAHCILDDAYHYLEQRRMSGYHNTRPEPPTKTEMHSIVEAFQEKGENTVENVPGSPDPCHSQHSDTENSEQTSSPSSVINGTPIRNAELPKIFMISAFDIEGVQRNASLISSYLSNPTMPASRSQITPFFLDDLAYTLSDKRSQFPWRSYALANSRAELAMKLAKGHFTTPTRVKSLPNIAFVFTGQGAQHYRMGRVLMHYSVFNKSLEYASAFIKSLGSSWDLLDELQKSKSTSVLDSPNIAHPACAALQIALIDLLRSWGVTPTRVIGHSSGEIPAAYCAGKLSREGALKAAYYRGRVSSSALSTKGAMVAVGLNAAKLLKYLEQVKRKHIGELIIACYNSPNNSTVSGDAELCDSLQELLDADGIFARRLKVQNAYHSGHMREVADEYLRLMSNLASDGEYFDAGHEIAMFSTVSGRKVVKKRLDASYWVDNLVSPVRFVDGLKALCSGGGGTQKNESDIISLEQSLVDHIIELGPHAALQSAVNEIVSQDTDTKIEYLSVLHRNDEDHTTLLKTVGTLRAKGSPIIIARVNTDHTNYEPRMLVSLPPYSFNHSAKIIAESHLSKKFRFREHPRHDLFGVLALDSTSDTPRWRHFIRLDENPWVKQHKVTNEWVYPGVGFIIMAIEAMRQLADPTARIRSFTLKHISLKQALIVPDTKEGIETCMTVTGAEESSLSKSATWKYFHISSYNPVADDWTEHCTGYISIEHETPSGPVDAGREEKAERDIWRETLRTVSAACRTPMAFDRVYENLQTVGMSYGPLFCNLSHVQTSGLGSSTGQVTIPDVQSAMPKNFLHPHLIHPATLDSILHLFLPAIFDLTGRSSLEKPVVPVFFDSVWVAGDFKGTPGHTLRGYAEASQDTFDKFTCDLKVWDGEEGCLKIQGLELAPLDSGNTVHSRKLCHTPIWTPDINLLDSASARRLASVTQASDYGTERYWVHRYQLAIVLLVADALTNLKGFDARSLKGHWRKYYEWLNEHINSLKRNHVLGFVTLDEFEAMKNSPQLKEALYTEVDSHGPDGVFIVRMGKNIVPGIKGEIEPLQVCMEDRLLDRVYDQMVHMGDLPVRFRAYLAALSKDRSGLNILEVGAGTGSSTAVVLDVLCPPDELDAASRSSAVANYTFTDISAGFFESSKKRFKSWSSIMTFKTLNIETDVVSQGFELGFYDIIVAGNVIHATSDLHKTLSNLRSLLRPGGKLILQECTPEDFRVQITVGQLPGWWLSVEENRKWGPLLPPAEWDGVLRRAGFSGVDVEMPSSEVKEFYSQTIMVSTVVGNTTPPRKTIVIIPDSSSKSSVVNSLLDIISRFETEVVEITALPRTDLTHTVCISLLELEQGILHDLDQDAFAAVKNMISKCSGLLWVTGDPMAKPQLNLVTGLMRTLRWEREVEAVNLVLLGVSDPRPSDETLAEAIARIHNHQFVESVERNQNGEYLLRDGIVHATRFVESQTSNDFLSSKVSTPAPEKKKLGDVGYPVKLGIRSAGLLDTLEWVPDPSHDKALGENEVEIDVRAVGLNFRDLMVAMGKHKAFSLGSEAAGIIKSVGSSVSKLKQGDRVVYLSGSLENGCFCTRGRVNEDLVVKISDSLSFEIAAGLPVIYGTVIYCLRDSARLSAGETILIHAAAGGVGQAAIYYSKLVGAEIYATVSTPEKRDLLVQRYGIREDHIFSSRDLSFAQGIKRCTGGKGVDVVLNSLAAEALRKTWECVAPFGRFIEIGHKDADDHGKLDLHPFRNNVTMTSVNLESMSLLKPQLLGRLIEDVIKLHSEGKIEEVFPITVKDFSQVEEGLRLLQSGKGMGKYVFVPTANDCVPVVPEVFAPFTFRQEASYVMAGGLGGLGRSIARWMVSRGARNLIFLSRTGRITDAVQHMVTDLEEKSCRVEIFTCDVSDVNRVKAVVDECSSSMPPIKGCIQGSMILKDAIFENMEYSDWKDAVAPKVQGSWNLHETLPKDMDFFLMLSSLNGIFGNRSQANYAAGNAYQDGLAKYRNSIGLPASTVDLGTILSVGFVAENKEYAKQSNFPSEALREDEVHSIIEFLIDPRHASEATQQLTFGFSSDIVRRERALQSLALLRYPMYNHMHSHENVQGVETKADDAVYPASMLLTAARSLEEAVAVVATGIRHKIASMLSIAVDIIEEANSISSYGIDSLSAIEVRRWLVKELGADIPFLQIVGTASIKTISEKVVGLSKLVYFDKAAV